MSTEQNALALLATLDPDQLRQLADLCSLVYDAGFDHGIGYGNQLDRLEAGDPRQPLQQIVKAAAAARQEVTRLALRWEMAAAVREEQYNKLVEQEQPAEVEQPASQVEQPADPPATQSEQQWAIIQVSGDKRYSIEVWSHEPYTTHSAVQNYVGPYTNVDDALAYIKANDLRWFQYEEDESEN